MPGGLKLVLSGATFPILAKMVEYLCEKGLHLIIFCRFKIEKIEFHDQVNLTVILGIDMFGGGNFSKYISTPDGTCGAPGNIVNRKTI